MNIITTITKITTTMDIITITKHGEYQDAHARAHANDIKRRFDGREVTNWQILLFGLTGGLIPCPAAITVLLICIQVESPDTGRQTLVVSFSIGLALTLVTVGVGAAISVQQVAKRWSGFNTLAKRAPLFFQSVDWLSRCVYGRTWLHGHNAITQSFRACMLSSAQDDS
ncbi:nickel/cobalt efflux protein RcnA [Escherichia coli]|nr:nickel/cobalt efflux protein RcnA [Escherichia coli]